MSQQKVNFYRDKESIKEIKEREKKQNTFKFLLRIESNMHLSIFGINFPYIKRICEVIVFPTC